MTNKEVAVKMNDLLAGKTVERVEVTVDGSINIVTKDDPPAGSLKAKIADLRTMAPHDRYFNYLCDILEELEKRPFISFAPTTVPGVSVFPPPATLPQPTWPPYTPYIGDPPGGWPNSTICKSTAAKTTSISQADGHAEPLKLGDKYIADDPSPIHHLEPL